MLLQPRTVEVENLTVCMCWIHLKICSQINNMWPYCSQKSFYLSIKLSSSIRTAFYVLGLIVVLFENVFLIKGRSYQHDKSNHRCSDALQVQWAK